MGGILRGNVYKCWGCNGQKQFATTKTVKYWDKSQGKYVEKKENVTKACGTCGGKGYLNS